MKIYYKLFIGIFICANFLFCNNSNLDEYLITKKSAGKIVIGEQYSDFINHYSKKYKVVHKKGSLGDYEAGVYIYDKDKLIIFVGNKNWGMPPYIVKSIIISSNLFKTKEGICVGMTTNELLKIFPTMKVDQSVADGLYHIYPVQYQSYKFSEKQIIFSLDLEFNYFDYWESDRINYINKNLNNLTGVIKSIRIWVFN